MLSGSAAVDSVLAAVTITLEGGAGVVWIFGTWNTANGGGFFCDGFCLNSSSKIVLMYTSLSDAVNEAERRTPGLLPVAGLATLSVRDMRNDDWPKGRRSGETLEGSAWFCEYKVEKLD